MIIKEVVDGTSIRPAAAQTDPLPHLPTDNIDGASIRPATADTHPDDRAGLGLGG